MWATSNQSECETTIFKKSEENNWTMLHTEAPSTFRIPISFFLRSEVNIAKPNNPKQVINIAKNENIPKTFPNFISALNCSW